MKNRNDEMYFLIGNFFWKFPFFCFVKKIQSSPEHYLGESRRTDEKFLKSERLFFAISFIFFIIFEFSSFQRKSLRKIYLTF